MRLTLRTMLAYLDDILEPDDGEDIAKKIEESEFATNLVHRVRDVTRRLRLGVPALEGRGLGSDPNTVAEYLDNTLPGDRVPEFEKVCLESDAHLAEVASCHQILTLVLGEPAEIPSESRQRMYGLAAHVDAPPVQRDAVRPSVAPATAAGAPAPPRRPKPEVPEYLRESRSRFWPVAATVLVAALLTCGALMLLGPAEWRGRLVSLLASGVQSAEEASEPAPEQAPEAATEPAPPAQPAVDNADAAPTETPAADAAPAGEPAQDQDNAASSVPGATIPPAADSAATPTPEAPEAMPDESAPAPPEEQPRAAQPGTPDEKMPDEATTDKADDGPPAAVPESFGRYHAQGEVLLRFDEATSQWKRLASMSPLAKGDRLLSLPSFRPMITLSTNISLRADGAALFQLVDWTPRGVPIVAIEYGRLVMMTVGKPSNSLQLKIEDHEPLLTFVDAESTAALEVRRVLAPGKNPEDGPAPLTAELYASSGLIRVSEDQVSIDMQAPAHRLLFAPASEQPANDDFPKWVTGQSLPDIERLATTTVEPALPIGEPVTLALKELADKNRREVRSLAARSLCYLGDFEPCIKELNDARYKALWPSYVDELRAAIARSPEAAKQLHAAWEKQRPADAQSLYRMLWGYSAEDLRNGAARDLVDGLSNDSLDVRVLSFLNLKSISNATHSYAPEDTAAKRQAATLRWQRILKDGRIVPRGTSAPAKSKAGKSAS